MCSIREIMGNHVNLSPIRFVVYNTHLQH